MEAYRAVYVDGSRHLLEALARAGLPQRLIFASSTSVYAQEDGSWVDERSPTEPVDPRGQLLLEAEAAWGVVGGRTAVVRFGGIYGPGRTRLIEQVRSGATRLPAGPVYTNRIHREDCAGALLHLLDLAQPAPLYAGVDREPADLADVLRFIAERVGVGELAVGDGAPVRGRGGSKRVRSDRLVGTGFEFVYPTYREGYGALIDQVGK